MVVANLPGDTGSTVGPRGAGWLLPDWIEATQPIRLILRGVGRPKTEGRVGGEMGPQPRAEVPNLVPSRSCCRVPFCQVNTAQMELAEELLCPSSLD